MDDFTFLKPGEKNPIQANTCKNCRFALAMKANLRDVILECREGPPEIAYAIAFDNGQPAGIRPLSIVPRIVPESFYCGRFQPNEKSVS